MFVIRNKQFQVFQEASRRRLEDRMILYLRTEFADLTESKAEDQLRDLIRTGIKRAESYKVVLEDDVRRYLDCMMVYGPDFDTNPATKWAGLILGAGNLTGTEKMDFIEKRRKGGG